MTSSWHVPVIRKFWLLACASQEKEPSWREGSKIEGSRGSSNPLTSEERHVYFRTLRSSCTFWPAKVSILCGAAQTSSCGCSVLALQVPFLYPSPGKSKLCIQEASKIPGCLGVGSTPKHLTLWDLKLRPALERESGWKDRAPWGWVGMQKRGVKIFKM